MSKRQLDHSLVCDKIGFDWANKKMMIRVYDSLLYVMENYTKKPTWVAIVKHMLTMDGVDLNSVAVNGYYSTIRKNLKDIGVIQYNGRKGLVKGDNWDRFFGDEDWSWFITNTNSGGYGTIVK
jgi:transposase